jgi:endonuclease YncB( thermonuclease family)
LPKPSKARSSVADGDLITVLVSNKEQNRIRLAGIDAPGKGQPFGNASRKKLRELVAGKDVRVEFEKYDRYGRLVEKVWVSPPPTVPHAKREREA